MKLPSLKNAFKSVMVPNRGLTDREVTIAFNKCADQSKALLDPYWEQGLVGISVNGGGLFKAPSYKMIFREGSKPDLKELPKKIGDFKISTSFCPIHPEL